MNLTLQPEIDGEISNCRYFHLPLSVLDIIAGEWALQYHVQPALPKLKIRYQIIRSKTNLHDHFFFLSFFSGYRHGTGRNIQLICGAPTWQPGHSTNYDHHYWIVRRWMTTSDDFLWWRRVRRRAGGYPDHDRSSWRPWRSSVLTRASTSPRPSHHTCKYRTSVISTYATTRKDPSYRTPSRLHSTQE